MPDYRPICTALGGALPDWPFAPIFAGNWRELPPELVLAFQSQSARDEVKGAAPLPNPLMRMRALKLGFYPGWLLAEVLSAYDEDCPGVFTVLIGPEGYTLLNGESATLHALNARILKLGRKGPRIDQYLHFFTSSLRAERGPFRIFEQASDIEREFRVTKHASAKLAGLVKPIRRLRGSCKGYVREACVLYGRDLFMSRFRVQPIGMVEMLEDEPIIKDVIRNPHRHEGIWRLPHSRRTSRRCMRNEPL